MVVECWGSVVVSVAQCRHGRVKRCPAGVATRATASLATDHGERRNHSGHARGHVRMVGALSLLLGLASRGGSSGRPNIIMALGDDTGWHGVSWHQSEECRADADCAMLTPHMEAALQEGIELDQHYTYRFCSPTRAALLTGRLPIHVNQMNSAEYPWTAAAMHPSFVTMAEALRGKAGYATHQLGKWHLGLARQAFTPAGRGFDTSVGYLSGSEKHFSHMKGAEACKSGPLNCTATCAVDFWHTAAPATGFDGVYSAEVYGSETVKIIEQAAAAASAAQPFFVYLAFADTHEPLEAPQRFQDL